MRNHRKINDGITNTATNWDKDRRAEKSEHRNIPE